MVKAAPSVALPPASSMSRSKRLSPFASSITLAWSVAGKNESRCPAPSASVQDKDCCPAASHPSRAHGKILQHDIQAEGKARNGLLVPGDPHAGNRLMPVQGDQLLVHIL